MNDIKETVKVLKALSDETRLRLVLLLAGQAQEAALCVGALAHSLGISQSAVSQHLGVLRAADLVIDERRGYFVHYRINHARLGSYLDQVRESIGKESSQASVE